MTRRPDPLPDHERKRLEGREKAQRRETKGMGLPVEPISIDGLWLLQRGLCGCLDRCGPLNPNAKTGEPDAIIIGHIHARRFKGWHTAENVRLQRNDCNQRHSGQENAAAGLGQRMTPNILAPAEKLERKIDRQNGSKWHSRGFQKPEGYKYKWAKRPMKGR